MNPKIIIGVTVIVAALVYLIVASFQDNTLYYMTVGELYAQGRMPVDKGLRINGAVDPSSIQWNAQKIELLFTLTEGKDSLRVVYQGPAPDQLADGQQAVVEGKLDAGGVFHATKISLKCPSKYEAKRKDDAKR